MELKYKNYIMNVSVSKKKKTTTASIEIFKVT